MLYITANMCEQSAHAEHIQVMLRTSFEQRHEINIAAGAYNCRMLLRLDQLNSIFSWNFDSPLSNTITTRELPGVSHVCRLDSICDHPKTNEINKK